MKGRSLDRSSIQFYFAKRKKPFLPLWSLSSLFNAIWRFTSLVVQRCLRTISLLLVSDWVSSDHRCLWLPVWHLMLYNILVSAVSEILATGTACELWRVSSFRPVVIWCPLRCQASIPHLLLPVIPIPVFTKLSSTCFLRSLECLLPNRFVEVTWNSWGKFSLSNHRDRLALGYRWSADFLVVRISDFFPI